MCKIGILLLDRDFEHDIYELIKAFYPEGDIHSLYEKDEEEYDIFFTVKKENDNFVIKYETKDQKGVASAEVIRGADGDSSQETHEKLRDAHELRKANKDSLKYALYNVLVKLTGRTLPWGKSYGNSSGQACHGDDREWYEKYRDCTGNAGALPGKRKENCSCHHHSKQGAGTSSGY